jgi:CRISPR-associated endonuclease Cas2
MERPGWYMVCYDIAHPGRLARIHRIMKKNGIAAQKSVFFVQNTEKGIKDLLGEIASVIKKDEDDIRAYPVESPQKVWTTGGILESFPLLMPGRQNKHLKKAKSEKTKSLWQRLFGR